MLDSSGVHPMRESDTYMAIIDEGREIQTKKIILRQGEKRFGPPRDSDRAVLISMTDMDRLEYLADRLLDVGSWQELLELP